MQKRTAFDQQKIEMLVKKLVSEYMKANEKSEVNNCKPMNEEEMDNNISKMLDNLDLFL